jgi:hypothetical protein
VGRPARHPQYGLDPSPPPPEPLRSGAKPLVMHEHGWSMQEHGRSR